MAKTRIKTTPTRMQKEALIASAAAVTTTTNVQISAEHFLKKRLTAFNHSQLSKEASVASTHHSTIIVQPPPKRTNSISSVTSTISHTSSDGSSSVDSSPPPPPLVPSTSTTISTAVSTPTNSNGPTMAELTENAIKTLNAGLLAKSNAMAMKNRKVYMITEKCDDYSGVGGTGGKSTNGGNNNGSMAGSVKGNGGGGQKRKMYLIMEEKDTTDYAEKFMKSECNSNNNGAKKLTLFTDTANGQLPQKIEKILPEILNCIQAKGAAAAAGGGGGGVAAGGGNNVVTSKPHSNVNECSSKTQILSPNISKRSLLKINESNLIDKNNERLPLTLPPKKNRTKIITTQIIPVVNSSSAPSVVTTNAMPKVVKENGNKLGEGGGGGGCPERGVTTVYRTTNGNAIGNGNGYRNVNGNGIDNTYSKTQEKSIAIASSGATPVIVSAHSLFNNGSSNNNGTTVVKLNGSIVSSSSVLSSSSAAAAAAAAAAPQMHKNINLSTDFLFLMKMLPKLESIAETHKAYVKSCIEDVINQYSTIDPVEDQ